MDYSTLSLKSGQIRLITILPARTSDDQIECLIEAVDLRTTAAEEGKGGLPENYIHFDEWVTNKPKEAFGAAFFRDIQKLEQSLQKKEGKRSKALRSVARFVGSKSGKNPLERDEMEVDVNNFGKLITMDDILANIENEELLESYKLSQRIEGPSHVARFSLKQLPHFYSMHGQSKDIPATVDGFANFVAMSYAWGDPAGPRTKILLNGYDHEVGESLFTGLRQFRTMEFFQNGGKIWIDALCINQNDDIEKVEQLKLMGSVYRFAGNIIVWLGAEDQWSGPAIDTLQSTSGMYRTEYIEVFDQSDPILAAVNREQAHFRLRANLQRFHKVMREHAHELATGVDDVAVYHVFNRGYWRRLWIIQELTNGRAGMPIVCGNRVTQWRYIRDAAFLYAAQFDLVKEDTARALGGTAPGFEHSIYHVAGIAQLEVAGHRKVLPPVDEFFLPVESTPGLGHGPLRGSTLKQALMVASQANAFVSKDRVYGMLQIPGLPDLNIDVDYKKSLGTVYTEFTKACIQAGPKNNLDPVFLVDGVGLSSTDANNNPQEKEDLPSWVPDYGAKRSRRTGPIEGTWYAGLPPQIVESLPNGTSMTPDVLVNGNTLTCWGFFADVITGVGAINPQDLTIFKPDSGFATGVVQPMDFEELVAESTYKPGYAEIEELLNHVRTLTTVNQWNTTVAELEKEEIWNALVGGAMIGGAKAPLGFECLLRTWLSERTPSHPDYRTWHFINSNLSFLLPNNRTFISYFTFHELAEPSTPMSAPARQAMEYRTRNRRLILSSRGHLGLAALATQPGDCILIVQGHGLPIIARPSGIATDNATGEKVVAWRMVGEAYVNRMMEGEMFGLRYDRPKETQLFHFL